MAQMAREQVITPEQSSYAPPATIGKILLLGLVFDIAANGQIPGASVPMFFLITVLVFQRELAGTLDDRLLVATALVVSSFAVLRASQLLVGLDVVVSLGLFALAAIPAESPLSRASLISYVRRSWALGTAGLLAPAYLLAPIVRARAPGRLRRTRPLVRTLAAAVPVVVVFAVLLASADRVFGDLITPGLPHWRFESVFSHLFFVALGIGAAATLARAAAGPSLADPPASRRAPKLGVAEWVTVLVGVDALFALFVGVQFAVLFGGRNRVIVTPGLTYAQYARSGFFQLIVVAALTVLVILGAWDLGSREGHREVRVFRILVAAMVGMSGVILLSAWKRLSLYDSAFGFTVNRFAAMIAIAWIGFVLIAVLVALWVGARARVVAVVLAGSLATLVVVNLINPDHFIAEQNVARFDRTGKIDAGYLAAELGPDAVPVAVGVLPRLNRSDAAVMRAGLCAHLGNLEAFTDFRSWSLGRARARSALAAAGFSEQSCSKPKR